MDIPTSLGKYPVIGVLGRGAMGVVYRAYDPLIRRPVAIKTILKELFEGELNADQVTARFRKEAQAAGALNHPGIVGVYEYGETDEHAYIAMECVEGTSLREFFNQSLKFPESDVVSIMAQLLEALEFAHNHSVVHRDVKPANLIIMKNGRLKLADFGIARLEAGDRTQTNLIMGTPGYIAPEYYLNEPIDHRVDIYAAGVVFYELLSGRVPFSGPPESVMHSVCYDDPPPPSTFDPANTLPQYDAVVARALRKRAENRYPSAGAFRTALLEEYRHPLPEAIATTVIFKGQSELEAGQPPTPPPTGWDAAVLTNLKTELAQFLGPVAKILVQRSARQCRDLEELVGRLARKIEVPEDQAAFTRRALGYEAPPRGSTEAAPRSTPPAAEVPWTPPAVPATAQDIDELVRRLSEHIGPVARVLVRRIQVAGLSRADLYMKAADALDDEAVRRRFLQEAAPMR
jgi:tRNA A-37 threonylcarbamoyl transferase component Bud32